MGTFHSQWGSNVRSQMHCKSRTFRFWSLTAIKGKKSDYVALSCFYCAMCSRLLHIFSKSHNFVKVQHWLSGINLSNREIISAGKEETNCIYLKNFKLSQLKISFLRRVLSLLNKKGFPSKPDVVLNLKSALQFVKPAGNPHSPDSPLWDRMCVVPATWGQ